VRNSEMILNGLERFGGNVGWLMYTHQDSKTVVYDE